ncbi:MAG TPA: hypothetical protein VFX07_04685 [Candidatus Udaeobacter sp.]|jgi:hypothetical protein|nr:hypothetical protein [Candidatus Udaeobacter sp.]
MAQRKESKPKIKVRDLKPKKDTRGGVVADVNAQAHQQNHSVQTRGTQGKGHSVDRWI